MSDENSENTVKVKGLKVKGRQMNANYQETVDEK